MQADLTKPSMRTTKKGKKKSGKKAKKKLAQNKDLA